MRHTLLLLAFAGCTLDPLVSDDPGASLHIEPPGTTIPHVSENADLTRQIRVNDGLSDSALEMSMGVIGLKKGYAKGAPVQYWDLGEMPQTGALLYVFGRLEGETFVPINHLALADSLPGDPGYSPYWFVQHVVVTDKYLGEIFPTLEALADGVELGLLEEPVPAEQFVDGPIVPLGTKLSLGGEATQATVEVYARGFRVDMLQVGGKNAFQPLERAGRVTRGDVHTVRVANAVSALKEPVFQNGAEHWTPAVRLINCHVAAAAPEDPQADIHDEAQLFVRNDMGAMVEATPRVLDWVITMSTKNWPIFVPEAP